MCFSLAVNHRLPFNSKNPIGYAIAVVLEYKSILCGTYFAASLISLGIGSFLFITNVVTKDVKDILKSINKNADRSSNGTLILKEFSDYFQLHSKAKQLSKYILIVGVLIN